VFYHSEPDGQGGAYVLFNSDSIRILRLDPSGSPAAGWSTCGIAMGADASDAGMALDGEGGVFVTWAPDDNLFLNRVRSDGSVSPGWPGAGVRLRSAEFEWHIRQPLVSPDAAGGAYVFYARVFQEYRFIDTYLTMAHVSAAGIAESDSVFFHHPDETWWWLASDARGGAWVLAATYGYSMYHQLASGTLEGPMAMTLGTWVSTFLADATGGWTAAGGSSAISAISAARTGPDGQLLPDWAPRLIDPGPSVEIDPRFALDGAGGLLIAWTDGRNPAPTAYATHLDADGTVHAGWDPQGTRLSDEIWAQNPVAIATDGAEGAYITWIAQGRLWRSVESDGGSHHCSDRTGLDCATSPAPSTSRWSPRRRQRSRRVVR
jgi:hypothetical protein